MIHIRCRTNLDGYETTNWPDSLCCRPMIGDLIESLCRRRVLKIVGITHALTTSNEPILLIELNR